MAPSQSALNCRSVRKAALLRFWACLTSTGHKPGRHHICGDRLSAAPRRNGRARLLSGLAAAALLAAGERPAVAAPPCMQEAEKVAFDVRALQSQMMVVALVCGRQDDYDTLVRRHQSDFLSAYQGITSHFRRLHGARAGETERDRYITELAQIQAQEQARQGTTFCGNMDPLVRRAMVARDTDEIARISTVANLATPHYRLAACVGPVVITPETRKALAAPLASNVETGEHDEEMDKLRARLAQLEKLLDRQSEPPLRRVRTR
jgi:hypothetical protein